MFGHDNQDNNQTDDNKESNFGAEAIHPDDRTAADEPASSDQPVTNDSDTPAYVPTPVGPVGPTPPPASVTDDLLDIKHQALQALTPLVGQLEQTPEEQFRTTMMMIQASDDHSLIKVAYNAAGNITNEKERAQALLDIVNEINYFTQHTQA